MSTKSRDITQTLILLVAVNAAIIYHNIIGYESYRNILDIASKLLLTSSIFIFLQLVFKNSRITHVLLFLIYFFSFTAELFNLSILNQYISFDNLNAVYHTNKTEVNEFVSNLLSHIWLPILIILILIINIIFLAKEKIAVDRYRSYFILLSFSLCLSFILIFVNVINSPDVFKNRNLVKQTWHQFKYSPPLNIFSQTYSVYVSINRLNKTKVQRDNFKFGTSELNEKSPSLVVLVVSEGMRSSNWSINGYEKLTNPNLSETDNLVSFKKHYANANNTYNSIPLLITKATPQNPSVAYSEKSIISLFKEAGYRAIWISNQDIFYLGNQDEPDSTIITYSSTLNSDLEVITPFKDVLASNKDGSLFLMVNLVGNHGTIPTPYNNQFKPNSSTLQIEISPQNKEKLINDYDNKILVQDYVLSKIIDITKATEESSVVLFTADHGLNLFDDNDSNIFGYGSDYPTKYELNIPLLVWCSDSYITNNKDRFNSLINSTTMNSDNDDIMHTLSDLSNISFREFDSSKSLSNEKYVSKTLIPVYINKNYILFDPETSKN